MHAALLFIAASVLWPQVQPAALSDPAFDVISIRPSDPNALGEQAFPQPGGKFRGINLSVRKLIAIAYGFRTYEVQGGSDWLSSARFDIAAQGPVKSSPDEMTRMLQALLRDRFGLRFHRQLKDEPVYELVAGKDPVRMKNAAAPGRGIAANPGKIAAFGVPMDLLAKVLSDQLDRQVIDLTGLPGYYDFDLTWSPDEMKSGPPDVRADPDTLPSIFTAVSDRLGLKLRKARRAVDVFMIDAIQTPTEN